MSSRRLLGTTVAMAAVAAALAFLTPSIPAMTHAVLAAQGTTDTAGAEALLLAVVGLLAWSVWAWGALGLLLTAASALPGVLGRGADLLTRVVLPAGARRGAALALGIGLGVAGPMAGTAFLVATAPAASADLIPPAVPDWPGPGSAAPTPSGPAVPDWPAPPTTSVGAAQHVVLRGDCLWDIATAHLSGRLGRAPAPAEIVLAAHEWWRANAAVIGPDPDLLLPGQVLSPPP